MGHTKPADLADLKSELARLRKLPGMKEKTPGVFYLKSTPFLHFHDKEGIRWADIKVDGEWQRVEINFAASAQERAAFMVAVGGALR